MPAFALSHVSDTTLLANLDALVATDRDTTAALLAHIAEVDARDLYREAACSSMFAYCTRHLRMAAEVAYKRIRAARTARRFPQIFEAIADGRLHVTGVVVLTPHLTDENVERVLAAATYASKADLELLVARIAPRPDIPASITPLDPVTGRPAGWNTGVQLDPDPARGDGLQLDLDPVRGDGLQLDLDPVRGDVHRLDLDPVRSDAHQLDLDPVPAEPFRLDQGPGSAPGRARVTALAPDRFAVQLTISGATHEKLVRAQAVLRHKIPSGDLAAVLDEAFDALLVKIEKKKFGATTRPRARKARPVDADPSYVPSEVRRAVRERDGDQCTFVSAAGERCPERSFLELDHIVLVAHGGQSTIDNLRLRCRPHNQHTAELALGRDFMREKRARGRKATVATAAARAAGSPSSTRMVAPDASAQKPDTPAADSPTWAAPSVEMPTPNPTPGDTNTGVTRKGATNMDAANMEAENMDATNVDATSTRVPSMDAAYTGAPETETPAVHARVLDADVTDALQRLGFKAGEVRGAVATTRERAATTFEERIRQALAVLTRSRCSEGAFDAMPN
jgi:hypothetical protein